MNNPIKHKPLNLSQTVRKLRTIYLCLRENNNEFYKYKIYKFIPFEAGVVVCLFLFRHEITKLYMIEF